uniref:CSON003023 protein n=1 Tax=Culicoides sonorensis TaxID=179676 RepID=A0A336MLR0_CULSO
MTISDTSHPSTSSFHRHAIIKPKIFHGIHKTALNHTLEESGLHASHLTLHYIHHGKNVIIDLNLNDNLIPKGHFIKYQLPNGDKIIKNFTKTDVDLCHYQGKIRHNPNSHAAISTCNGVRGVVFDGDETYYIENVSDGVIDSEHFLFRHSDLSHEHKCGYEGGIDPLHDPDLHLESEYKRIERFKRALPNNNDIRGPYNANKHSSYVELLMVVDNKVYTSMDKNIKRVHQHCKDIVNIINGLYVPLNIFVALIGVVIWTESNEVELSSNGDTTLKNFLHYRKKILVKEHPNDNAQLLTKETFESGVVGKALKGPICTYEFSGGVSIDHSPTIGVVATTVAHEMGHNFGMEHDTAECVCPDDKCIMSASSSSIAPRHWSKCSIDQLNLAFHHGMNHCLKNKPKKLFESPVCGNGFVEHGEDCDCGLPEFCDNSCCDPLTCRLRSNATCATGECCDMNTCLPKTAGIICRTADSECDLPEFCNGDSEYCPFDVFKRDSEPCGNNKAYCYQGSCRTQSDQCRLLWGPSGQSTDQCYTKNTEGSRHGNCGYNRYENEYIKCKAEDAMCGMVHCRHLNERLEFGMESVAVLSHSFMNYKGSIIPCRTAIVDLGLETMDPGLAPNGAKCGEGKMCFNQSCVSVEHLKKSFVTCKDDCNGNGICNSLGNCHCDLGFAPPFCDKPGTGGSIDSGPASDPDEGSGLRKLILVFFLGVVPTVVIAAFLLYYWKQHYLIPIRKAPSIPPRQLKSSNGLNSTPSFGSSTTPNSPDDMNSALLKKSSSTETDSSPHNINMFGKFRGFTLKPLAQSNGPISATGANNIAYVHPVTKSIASDSNISTSNPTKKAPPIPKPPIILNTATKSPKKSLKSKNSTFTENVVGKVIENGGKDISFDEKPALPPLNPGQTGRPIISSPILENSTCDRREISPLEVKITRPAPPKPAKIVQEKKNLQRATSPQVPEILVNPTIVDPDEKGNKEPKKPKDGQILNRITSFLKKDEKVAEVEVTEKPKSVNVKPVLKTNRKPIDRERLKTIEISCPIPIVSDTPDIPTLKDDGISRTQSMRDSNTLGRRPNNFGASMRQNGMKRPQSIVGRPNLPPPPRPPSPVQNKPSSPNLSPSTVTTYENPPPPKKVVINDMTNRSPMKSPAMDIAPLAYISEESSPMTPTDNIYDEIGESLSPSSPQPHSTSTESMGLLGEIVSEIENRNNSDALYIASTLRKSKTNKNKNNIPDNVYMNTVNVSESDGEDNNDEEYLSQKSIASTTSSGYMRPTGIATPVARVAPNTGKSFALSQTPSHHQSNVSSFKMPASSNVTSSISPSNVASNSDMSNISFTSPINSDDKNSIVPNKPESLRTYKPYHTTINRPGPYLASIQAKSTAENSKNTPIPSKTTKLVTNTVKSPDLIPKSKEPDVIKKSTINSKPKPSTNKPTIPGTKATLAGTNTAVNKAKSKFETKTSNNAVNSTPGKFCATIPAKSTQVASLSQKFEGERGTKK